MRILAVISDRIIFLEAGQVVRVHAHCFLRTLRAFNFLVVLAAVGSDVAVFAVVPLFPMRSIDELLESLDKVRLEQNFLGIYLYFSVWSSKSRVF
jgi:hypothetical protein